MRRTRSNPFGEPMVSANPPPSRPVLGQQVVFERASGAAPQPLTAKVFTLARAEDASASHWQVTLSPIYRLLVGSTDDAMPGLQTLAADKVRTGAPNVRLTWGGGGVTYRTEFQYPANGSSFVVAGDNVMVEVYARDYVTTFTDGQLPAVSAWVAPTGNPTAASPVMVDFINGTPGNSNIRAFARVLLVALANTTATANVTFDGAFGPSNVTVPAGGGVHRIPIPCNANIYSVAPTVGTVACGFELAFT